MRLASGKIFGLKLLSLLGDPQATHARNEGRSIHLSQLGGAGNIPVMQFHEMKDILALNFVPGVLAESQRLDRIRLLFGKGTIGWTAAIGSTTTLTDIGHGRREIDAFDHILLAGYQDIADKIFEFTDVPPQP